MHHRPCIQLFEKVKQWDDQLRVDPAYVRKVSPSTLSTRTVCPPPSPAPGPTDDMAVITLHAEAARGAYFLPLLIAILFCVCRFMHPNYQLPSERRPAQYRKRAPVWTALPAGCSRPPCKMQELPLADPHLFKCG